MPTAVDVSPQALIMRVARYLKSNSLVTPPDWASIVKTGVHKERPPSNPDWWYVRCASMLRKLYVHGPLGVSRLKSHYGGRRRRGMAPPKFHKGSGSITRKVLQQLEEAGLLVGEGKKGRKLSSKGRRLLDETARVIIQESRRRRGGEKRQRTS